MNAQSLLMSAAYYMEDVSDPVSTLLWIGLAILEAALILVVVFLRFVPLGLWITSLAAGVQRRHQFPGRHAAASHPAQALGRAAHQGPQGRTGRYSVQAGNAFAGRRQRLIA